MIYIYIYINKEPTNDEYISYCGWNRLYDAYVILSWQYFPGKQVEPNCCTKMTFPIDSFKETNRDWNCSIRDDLTDTVYVIIKLSYLRNVFLPTEFLCNSTVSHVSRTRYFWAGVSGIIATLSRGLLLLDPHPMSMVQPTTPVTSTKCWTERRCTPRKHQ